MIKYLYSYLVGVIYVDKNFMSSKTYDKKKRGFFMLEIIMCQNGKYWTVNHCW